MVKSEEPEIPAMNTDDYENSWHELAMNLAQLASYSEIVGDIKGDNGPHIRKACNAVFEKHRARESEIYKYLNKLAGY